MGSVEVNKHFVKVLQWVKAEKAALEQRKREIEEIESAARQEVEKQLGENEFGEVGGKTAVTWKHGKTSQLDQAALKRERPEVHAAYTRKIPTRRFHVLKGSDGDGSREI